MNDHRVLGGVGGLWVLVTAIAVDGVIVVEALGYMRRGAAVTRTTTTKGSLLAIWHLGRRHIVFICFYFYIWLLLF